MRRWRRVMIMALLLPLLGVLAVVATLRFVDPPTSAFMLAQSLRGYRAEAPRPWVNHHWVPLQAMPRHLPLAAVAAEDQRFAGHFGFDFVEMRAALEARERGAPLRGASTLSQQTAKNVFLWPARSWLRKALEAGLTVLIELTWPKRRILEIYLNVAQFGPRTFGVGAAARHHFGRDVGELTPKQSALLVAALPAPNRFSPGDPGPRLARRAAWVEGQMRRLGDRHLDGILGTP